MNIYYHHSIPQSHDLTFVNHSQRLIINGVSASKNCKLQLHAILKVGDSLNDSGTDIISPLWFCGVFLNISRLMMKFLPVSMVVI